MDTCFLSEGEGLLSFLPKCQLPNQRSLIWLSASLLISQNLRASDPYARAWLDLTGTWDSPWGGRQVSWLFEVRCVHAEKYSQFWWLGENPL